MVFLITYRIIYITYLQNYLYVKLHIFFKLSVECTLYSVPVH